MLSTGETNHGFIGLKKLRPLDRHSEIKDGFRMWDPKIRDMMIDGNLISGGRQRVTPSELIPILTKAIQELSAEVETLKTKVD